MSHAAMPSDVKDRLGISEGLLRYSVGIEDIEDLWKDLDTALSGAHRIGKTLTSQLLPNCSPGNRRYLAFGLPTVKG